MGRGGLTWAHLSQARLAMRQRAGQVGPVVRARWFPSRRLGAGDTYAENDDSEGSGLAEEVDLPDVKWAVFGVRPALLALGGGEVSWS
ncbi:unnamed protein product [Linum trigynum]|uniref:Uncharacterized protein n=1 Tax=Linum trigynum TaxID=586398 RepID=A0AAV2DQW3_9ROSI